jgi:hypothetical protein
MWETTDLGEAVPFGWDKLVNARPGILFAGLPLELWAVPIKIRASSS